MMTNSELLMTESSKIFECTICDYITSRKSQYKRHLSTRKHKKGKNDDKNDDNDDKKGSVSSVPKMVWCDDNLEETCDKKGSVSSVSKTVWCNDKKNSVITPSKWACCCGRTFMFRQGLWIHKQKCSNPENYGVAIQNGKMEY